MEYFYSSASMGFHGEGYLWHKPFQKLFGKFPKYPAVCKTITLNAKKGTPYNVFRIPFKGTTWNKIGLHNPGFNWWMKVLSRTFPKAYIKRFASPLIPSLYGTHDEVQEMIDKLHQKDHFFNMVEINVSCPNVSLHGQRKLPKSPYPLSLKVRYDDDPFKYDLAGVKRVTLNSIPSGTIFKGGLSGKYAQKYNWPFIKDHIDTMAHMGISLAGCSITKEEDIQTLADLGCTEIGLGSVMLINPRLVLKTGGLPCKK